MEACSQRSSLHFYAVDVAGNTYSNGSKKATAVCLCVCVRARVGHALTLDATRDFGAVEVCTYTCHVTRDSPTCIYLYTAS